MKRILCSLGLVACILLTSCSNPGGGLPTVTTTDRDQAVLAMSAANTSAFNIASSGNPSDTAVTYTGTYFSLSATFSPDLQTFVGGSGSATITETISGYHDPGSGYTISGTLVCTINNGTNVMTMSGNFSLSGGNVRTMSVNVTFNFKTMAYSGSATLNGQTFIY